MSSEKTYNTDLAEEMGDGDLAIAIAEDAFRAGYAAASKFITDPSKLNEASEVHKAWSDYTPPDHLCGRSFKE